MKKVRFYSIDWNTDGEEILSLPKELTISVDNDMDVSLEGADLLSDRYGFCVNSFNVENLEVSEQYSSYSNAMRHFKNLDKKGIKYENDCIEKVDEGVYFAKYQLI
jgi:hypothetical protein